MSKLLDLGPIFRIWKMAFIHKMPTIYNEQFESFKTIMLPIYRISCMRNCLIKLIDVSYSHVLSKFTINVLPNQGYEKF